MKSFHDKNYEKHGVGFQRKYPNEQVIKFVLSTKWPKNKTALDLGCGSGGNFKFLLENKFQATALDCCQQALDITRQNSKIFPKRQKSFVCGMLPQVLKNLIQSNKYTFILDCLCSYTLRKNEQATFLSLCEKILIEGGYFFSVYPSKNSHLFTQPGKTKVEEGRFLKEITREDSPFPNDKYGWNFETLQNYTSLLKKACFRIVKSELISLTYRNGKEKLEYLVVAGQKNGS